MEQGIIDNIVSKEVFDELKRLESALTKIESDIAAINKQPIDMTKFVADTKAVAESEVKLAVAKEKAVKKTDEEKIALQEGNRIKRLTVQLNRSAENSFNRMSAQYSLNRIEINKMSEAEIKADKSKQKLITDTEKLRKAMSASQKATGNATLDVGKYEKALSNLAAAGWAAAVAAIGAAFAGMSKDAEESEKSIQRLSFAVKNVGGGSDSDIAKLSKQASKLMGIFDDEQIMDAATTMLNYGLSMQQVTELLPKMVDAAAASGKSLDEMAMAIDKGVTSGVMARSALGQLGLSFKDTGSQAENYSKIIEGLTKFEGGNTEAMKAQWGQLANLRVQWGEIREQLGGILLKAVIPLAEGLVTLGNTFESTAKKMKRSTENITSGRLEDFQMELSGQKDKLKYIDKEIEAERNLYKAKQAKIKQNEETIKQDKAKGFFMESTTLQNSLKKENEGLALGVTRSVEYVNALAGMRQELRQGSGAVNIFSDSNDNANKKVKATVEGINLLRTTLQKIGLANEGLGKTDIFSTEGLNLGGLESRANIMADTLKKLMSKDQIEQYNKFLADSGLKQLEEDQAISDKKTSIYGKMWDTAKALGDSYFEWYNNKLEDESERNKEQSDKQLSDLEESNKQGLITNEDYQTQKMQIEADSVAKQNEIDQKQRQAKRDAFILEQAIAVAQIWVDYAKAVGATGFNPALQPWYLGEAIAMSALIAAQTIPAFAEGGEMGKDGIALVGDGGRSELVLTPDGQLYTTPSTPTVVSMEKGTQIFPDASVLNNRDIMRSIMVEAGINFDTKNLEKKLDKLIEIESKRKESTYRKPSLREEIETARNLKLN